MELFVFLLFAFFALGSALVVVLHRDPVKSTLSLVLTLASTAVLFILLGAPFIGTLQVLIYTGAIVVLFLFVVMLLNIQPEPRGPRKPKDSWTPPSGSTFGVPATYRHTGGWTASGFQKVLAIVGAIFFGTLVALAVWRLSAPAALGPVSERFVAVRALALELFQRFLLPFEIVGLLLLVAVIAAFILAKRPEPAGSAPATAHDDETPEGSR